MHQLSMNDKNAGVSNFLLSFSLTLAGTSLISNDEEGFPIE